MFTIKRGDTRYAMKVILKDGNGVPVDLTNCQVKVIIKGLFERTPHIQDAPNGEVWVTFNADDTSQVKTGTFYGEFKVTYPDYRIETFPNTGFFKIYVDADLKGE